VIKNVENNMKSKKPNCKICEWVSIGSIDGNKFKECGAQGYKIACDVYNNKMCRNLFRTVSRTNNIKRV